MDITSLPLFNNYAGMTAGDYLQAGTWDSSQAIAQFFVNTGSQAGDKASGEGRQEDTLSQFSV